MTLNRVKLGRAVTFMKYLATVFSLILLSKTLIWNKITFLVSNLLTFADRKRAYEEYLQKISAIFHFLSNLSLLIVKILRVYN